MKAISKSSISAQAAQKLVAAAQAKANELGISVAIAVVDEGGATKAMLRMDGAHSAAADLAQNKAYTAAAFSVPTDQWFDIIKNDGALLHGIPQIPRMVIFPGGYPVMDGNVLIGAIGISGGYANQDADVAQAALAELG